jgi:hypothetical protein
VERLNSLKVPHELSLHLEEFVRIKTGLQTVVQAGLLKEGICSVQDESAGQFGLVIIWTAPEKRYSLLFINFSCC